MQQYILAEKHKNEFTPTEAGTNLNDIMGNLEYGDVHEGMYQIWEYPSNKVFNVLVDREVEDENYYSLPDVNLWLPKLEPVSVNEDLVKKAITLLEEKRKRSFLYRLKRLLR